LLQMLHDFRILRWGATEGRRPPPLHLTPHFLSPSFLLSFSAGGASAEVMSIGSPFALSGYGFSLRTLLTRSGAPRNSSIKWNSDLYSSANHSSQERLNWSKYW